MWDKENEILDRKAEEPLHRLHILFRQNLQSIICKILNQQLHKFKKKYGIYYTHVILLLLPDRQHRIFVEVEGCTDISWFNHIVDDVEIVNVIVQVGVHHNEIQRSQILASVDYQRFFHHVHR